MTTDNGGENRDLLNADDEALLRDSAFLMDSHYPRSMTPVQSGKRLLEASIEDIWALLDAARQSSATLAAEQWRAGVEAAASWLMGWREEDPPEYLTIDDWRWLGRKREEYAARIRRALLPTPPTEAGEPAQQPAVPICTCGRLHEGTRLTQHHERGCPMAQQPAAPSSAKPLTAEDPARVEKMLRDHAALGSEALCIMSSESAAILRLLDAARAALRGTREAVAEDDRKHLALAREIGKILDPQQALNTAALAASRYQRRLDAAEARVKRLEGAIQTALRCIEETGLIKSACDGLRATLGEKDAICTCGRLREGTRLTAAHARDCPMAQQPDVLPISRNGES